MNKTTMPSVSLGTIIKILMIIKIMVTILHLLK